MGTKFGSKLYPILVIPLVFMVLTETNECPPSSDEILANEITSGMTAQSKLVSEVLRKTTLATKTDITRIADALEKSESDNPQVKELREIADELGHSVDLGVVEMGGAMKDTILLTNNIANILSNKEMAEDLTNSVDKSVTELGSTIRFIGDKIMEFSREVQVRLNSSDLIDVARDETKEGLVEAINQLTTDWYAVLNTADLKDVGYAATHELSQTLQNINARIEVKIGTNDDACQFTNPELSSAIVYIGGFAIVVLFVTLFIPLKECRNCLVQVWVALGQGIASGFKKSNCDDADNVERSERRETLL